ncbi:MAG: hypothetical protein XXXJIFNMEKO3_03053 [Candidatus Erwinia impunctatus]|nr:hypothetical protein XXXJIFNMEKO_03053 [Culicoides impunctatus]
MIWPFLAVFFSGWLYVDACYLGPHWQRWFFKPVTLLLLLALAFQAHQLDVVEYLILAGLLASLTGDALSLLPERHRLYTLGAFFLSHLLYTFCFATNMTLSFVWPVPLTLLIVGIVIMAIIWTPLGELRWPAFTLMGITLIMVWVAIQHYLMAASDRSFSTMCGAILLLVAHALWLITHYRKRFPADSALIAACYFGGHFMVVKALYL